MNGDLNNINFSENSDLKKQTTFLSTNNQNFWGSNNQRVNTIPA